VNLRLLLMLAGGAAFFWSVRRWQRAVAVGVVLLIFEGAIRKWLLPGAQDLIYFAKDVFFFGAYGSGDPLILPPTALAFASLTALPAVYAGGGAWLTRRIGFSPFVLGVGWMGVELVLAPLGLHNGLLAGTQGDTALMDYIGRALGYVLVAFLVAYVNAALVAVLGRVRLSVPRFIPTAASPDRGRSLISQIIGCLSPFALQPSQARAPPF